MSDLELALFVVELALRELGLPWLTMIVAPIALVALLVAIGVRLGRRTDRRRWRRQF